MAPKVVDGRKLRAQRRRAATEAKLLFAAESVICRRGFHAATIADIVDEAQVARGTFYQYFDSREAVYRRLIGDFVKLLTSSVERVTERRAPVEDVRTNLLRVLEQLFAQRELAILLFRDALTPDPVLKQLHLDLHQHMHRMVCGLLRRGAQWGILREVEVEGTAWAVIGAIKELLLRRIDELPTLQTDEPVIDGTRITPAVRQSAVDAASVLVDAFYGGLRAP
ncbi:MAG: TetR/AcrR family transcriptional regulator [Deltaproteobacteria bacterium]|nr:MAG: TetR/AcrR family transcriptional regulator [Deltaproteobacteria bacterium]